MQGIDLPFVFALMNLCFVEIFWFTCISYHGELKSWISLRVVGSSPTISTAALVAPHVADIHEFAPSDQETRNLRLLPFLSEHLEYQNMW